MPTSPKTLLTTLMASLENVPERYVGYRKAMITAIGEIVVMEREHQIQSINIVQKIRDTCELLGEDLDKKTNVEGLTSD
jgi:hypothetical protein